MNDLVYLELVVLWCTFDWGFPVGREAKGDTSSSIGLLKMPLTETANGYMVSLVPLHGVRSR